MKLAVLDPTPNPVRRAGRPPPTPIVETSVEVRHVVFFLNDALPGELIVRMEHNPEAVTLAEALLSLCRFDGSRALEYPWNAKSVENALRAGHGGGYRLVGWRVLPNHVHVLIEAAPGWPMGDPIHRWKLASSPRRIGAPRPGLERFGPDRLRPRALRHELARPDEFWADEDFERILRTRQEVDEARRLMERIALPPPRPAVLPPEESPETDESDDPTPEPVQPARRASRRPKWLAELGPVAVDLAGIYGAYVLALCVLALALHALAQRGG
jgi:REP element-mobilizing transposase RayT